MNEMELLKKTSKLVQYKFFPNGDKNNFGIVQVDIESKKCSIVHDAVNVSGMFKQMAMVKIRELLGKNNFPETTMIAWY